LCHKAGSHDSGFGGIETVILPVYINQARSCPCAKNQLLAHHFGKKNQLLALKNIITDMGRIPLFQYN
jgi:hypothetical protein